jgi:hypothetical protein
MSTFTNTLTISTMMLSALSFAFATCDNHMLVFQRGGVLTGTESSSLHTMVSTLNGAGNNLCWDGSQTSNESTLVSLVNSGVYDVLVALNSDNSNAIWSLSTMSNLTSAMNCGSLKRLAVFDQFADVNPNVEGLNGMITQDLSATIQTVSAGDFDIEFNAQCVLDLDNFYAQLINDPVTNAIFPLFTTGTTILPGIYHVAGAVTIPAGATITLDGQGNTSSIFIFRNNGAFSTGASSVLILTNGALADNVFFVSGGAISLGATSTISGTMITSAGAVSSGVGAVLNGRMFTRAGAISNSGNLTIPNSVYPFVMGCLESFAIFTTIGAISNIGTNVIIGDIGTNSGAVNGFEPSTLTEIIYYPVDANAPPSTGPAGSVVAWAGTYEGHKQLSCIDYTSFLLTHPESSSYYINGNGKSVLIDYCLGDGRVVYSTIPMDYYLRGSGNTVAANNYFTNIMDQLIISQCSVPQCALRYRLLFAHSPTHLSYSALRVNGDVDDTCHPIGGSHQHVGDSLHREAHSVMLFANDDCTGSTDLLDCDEWLDYDATPSASFGTCSNDGSTLTVSGLPEEVTHVISGGDWLSVAVVNGTAEVACPSGSGEVGVCSGVDCNFSTEFMYNLLNAAVGSCVC